jgi:hypothetical protein
VGGIFCPEQGLGDVMPPLVPSVLSRSVSVAQISWKRIAIVYRDHLFPNTTLCLSQRRLLLHTCDMLFRAYHLLPRSVMLLRGLLVHGFPSTPTPVFFLKGLLLTIWIHVCTRYRSNRCPLWASGYHCTHNNPVRLCLYRTLRRRNLTLREIHQAQALRSILT